jgi:hypothetical protein
MPAVDKDRNITAATDISLRGALKTAEALSAEQTPDLPLPPLGAEQFLPCVPRPEPLSANWNNPLSINTATLQFLHRYPWRTHR